MTVKKKCVRTARFLSYCYFYCLHDNIKKTVSVHKYIQYQYATTSFISFQNSRKATIMATSFHTSRAWGILLPSKNQHGSLSNPSLALLVGPGWVTGVMMAKMYQNPCNVCTNLFTQLKISSTSLMLANQGVSREETRSVC